jgi:transcriptional regulator of acetoin/glycerol metabolism
VPLYEDASALVADSPTGIPTEFMNDAYHPAKDKLVAHFEREYLSRLVARAGGNMSKAARLASIDRTTLYRLMEKHSVRRDELSSALF